MTVAGMGGSATPGPKPAALLGPCTTDVVDEPCALEGTLAHGARNRRHNPSPSSK